VEWEGESYCGDSLQNDLKQAILFFQGYCSLSICSSLYPEKRYSMDILKSTKILFSSFRYNLLVIYKKQQISRFCGNGDMPVACIENFSAIFIDRYFSFFPRIA